MTPPATTTALYMPFPSFFGRPYPEQESAATVYRADTASADGLNRLCYGNYDATTSTPDHPQPSASLPTEPPIQNGLVAPPHTSQTSTALSNRTMSQRRERKANWNEFYRNGLPKEVIVIDDDSPRPATRQVPTRETPAPQTRAVEVNGGSGHAEKRRKVETNTAYDTAYHNPHIQPNNVSPKDLTNSASVDSRDRTTSALYSTAPTSLGSSTGSGRGRKPEESQTGQKRKRPARRAADEEEEEEDLEFVGHNDTWGPYIPPTKPLIKSNEVHVPIIRDRIGTMGQKMDDDDGHYLVIPTTDFGERYTITRLLGQGTFGKVIEAYDKKKRMKVAIKIIRAVPKYRDASRIELRVLSTLASNDKYNRNKCIHLRDCFDFRNHICIVTDLLSASVFDFLKNNAFVPFPSTHIQSFARQLFTSVAFLHDLNLIHTDLKPENILLVSDDYQTFTYNRSIPTSSKSGNRTARLRKVLLNPEIRLIDFGSATFDDEYHSSVVSTRHYRAPEIILNLGWSFPCDIWSIGCILVEFFTGDALFQTHDNLEHLAMMEAVCSAKIDKDIVNKVRAPASRHANKNSAASYFRPKAYALNYPNADTARTSRKFVKNMKRLDETIPNNNEFNRKFLDLLRRIFVYDPKKRITAKQALNHPWFKEPLQDDGTEALKIRIGKERAAFDNNR